MKLRIRLSLSISEELQKLLLTKKIYKMFEASTTKYLIWNVNFIILCTIYLFLLNFESYGLGLTAFNIFRHYRNFHTSFSKYRGDGVTTVPVKIRNNKIELLFVIKKLPHCTLIISFVYIPNRSNRCVFTEYFDCVEKILNKHPRPDVL